MISLRLSVTLLYEMLDFLYDIYFALEKLLRGTYTEKVISSTADLFKALWYYAIIGACAAVLTARLMSHKKVCGFLTRRGGDPIFIAAVLGVLSPMCTFAAIPLAGGLMAAGVPLGPLMAFLIASPLMNPSLFIITWGVIGPQMAIARTFSALLLAIVGGGIVDCALTRGWGTFRHPLRDNFSGICALSPSTKEIGIPSHSEKTGECLRQSYKMVVFILKYFLMALFLAGAVQTFIRPQWIAALLGGRGFHSVLLGGLLGIPLYVCGGGTIALIGVLVSMGMGQGAALAFFITGPATKISTIVSLNAVVRRNVALLYLGVTLIGGVIIGYSYSKIAPDLIIDSRYYGKVESKEDAVIYKPGIGSPQGE